MHCFCRRWGFVLLETTWQCLLQIQGLFFFFFDSLSWNIVANKQNFHYLNSTGCHLSFLPGWGQDAPLHTSEDAFPASPGLSGQPDCSLLPSLCTWSSQILFPFSDLKHALYTCPPAWDLPGDMAVTVTANSWHAKQWADTLKYLPLLIASTAVLVCIKVLYMSEF